MGTWSTSQDNYIQFGGSSRVMWQVKCIHKFTQPACLLVGAFDPFTVHPKVDQSWVFIGRTDFEAATPILWPPDAKSWLIWKDPDAGKDWGQEKGTTDDEMVGWHHWLNGHGFGWTWGVGDGQGGLACCCSWGRKELDTTERLNWTIKVIIDMYDSITILIGLGLFSVGLFLLLCFLPREVSLAFVVKLVWWCWILLIFACLQSFWFLHQMWRRIFLGRVFLLVYSSLSSL